MEKRRVDKPERNLHAVCTVCTLPALYLHYLHFLFRKHTVLVVLRRTNRNGR